MWSFRDTAVTSLFCAHMLSVNVPVVMRQPMNFNSVGNMALNCMVRHEKQ